MARTTISTVIESIRRELNSKHRYEVSALGATLTDTDTVVTLAYELPPSLREGAVIVVGTESMRVISVDPAPKELTVIRGWEGSTAAAHSSGAAVEINPRFASIDVYEALQDEVAGLPETLYRVDQTQVAVALGQDTIELPAAWSNLYGLIDARQFITDPITTTGVDRTSWPRIEGRVVRGVAATWTEGPSTGVYFRPKKRISNYAGTAIAGHVYFTAALPWDLTDVAVTADLVVDVGMQPSMLDVVKLGVKLRLLPDEEVGRSDRRGQDENRRASENPVGSALSAWRILNAQYVKRRTEESNRLRSLYPIVMS